MGEESEEEDSRRKQHCDECKSWAEDVFNRAGSFAGRLLCRSCVRELSKRKTEDKRTTTLKIIRGEIEFSEEIE